VRDQDQILNLCLCDQHTIEWIIAVTGQRARALRMGCGDRQLDKTIFLNLGREVSALDVEPPDLHFDGDLPDACGTHVNDGMRVANRVARWWRKFGVVC